VFGGACCIFDGNADYITYADSDTWDLFSSLTDSVTVDFWMKIPSITGGEQAIICQNQTTNYWYLGFYNNIVQVYASWSGTVTNWLPTQNADALLVADTWQHICFVKIANVGAFYIDGVQASYTSALLVAGHILNGNCYIGRNRDSSAVYKYFPGKLDEFRIHRSNYFNANPNEDKTDTIAVPTSEYSATNDYEDNVSTTISLTPILSDLGEKFDSLTSPLSLIPEISDIVNYSENKITEILASLKDLDIGVFNESSEIAFGNLITSVELLAAYEESVITLKSVVLTLDSLVGLESLLSTINLLIVTGDLGEKLDNLKSIFASVMSGTDILAVIEFPVSVFLGLDSINDTQSIIDIITSNLNFNTEVSDIKVLALVGDVVITVSVQRGVIVSVTVDRPIITVEVE
jgi:hypothetical protein